MSKQRIHIEMIGGLAGDMFLAASIDAGLVNQGELEEALGLVGLGPIQIQTEQVTRHGIKGRHLKFTGWDPSQERDHRHLSEIERMLRDSDLPSKVRERAIELFRVLGEVEADTHDIPLERVHFHEVGAIDSILDFVGAAYVIESNEARWTAGRVPTGQGMIETSHGTMPALAPATAKLLVGFELDPRGVDGELVTPTGATILRGLRVHEAAPARPGALLGGGFGAGTRDFDGFANVVRLTIHEEVSTPGGSRDRVVRLCAEVDDEPAELLAHAEQVLLGHGALDVTRTPVTMKKGRLGTQLAVLCRPRDRDRMVELILWHTSTFGVRVEELERFKLEREIVEVDTPWGTVRAKLGSWKGRQLKASPEYEDCARLARQVEVPLRRVYAAAQAALEVSFAYHEEE